VAAFGEVLRDPIELLFERDSRYLAFVLVLHHGGCVG
jgi:hypothetical protein